MATAIPTSHLLPLFWASMDASGANTAEAGAQPTLLVGHRLTGGTGADNTLYQITSAAEASILFGAGSLLHRQAIAYFANDSLGEVYAYAAPVPGGGVAATGKLTITGPATADGVLHLSFAGQPLDIAVSDTDTADAIGAAIALALPTHAASPTDYPVSAGNVAGVVTLTTKWKGISGNDVMIEVCPLGLAGRQALPAGVGCAITNAMGALAAGSGVPDVTSLAANIATFDLDHLVTAGGNIAGTLADIGVEFNDATGRWAYLRAQYGHLWGAGSATSSEQTTALTDINDQHCTYVAVEGNAAGFAPKTPNPPWEIIAAYAGRCAASLRADPAAPCQTLKLLSSSDGKVKFRAPAMSSRWGAAVRNSLLGDGAATVFYRGSDIYIEYERTTYTEGPLGGADNSYQDVQVLSISQKWLRECRSLIESNFGLAKNNAPTRSAIKGTIVAKAAEFEELGIFENVDDFAASLSVVQNPTNVNRVDVLARPDYVAALRQVCLTNQFRR